MRPEYSCGPPPTCRNTVGPACVPPLQVDTHNDYDFIDVDTVLLRRLNVLISIHHDTRRLRLISVTANRPSTGSSLVLYGNGSMLPRLPEDSAFSVGLGPSEHHS